MGLRADAAVDAFTAAQPHAQNTPPPQVQQGPGAPYDRMDGWGAPLQQHAHPQCGPPGGYHVSGQPLPQHACRPQAAAAATEVGGCYAAPYPPPFMDHGRGWRPAQQQLAPPFVTGTFVGTPFVSGPVPHEGVVHDSSGGQHTVVHKFTEFKTTGHRNLLCLLAQHHRQHVLFNGKLVGGSWQVLGDDVLHVSFHHDGVAMYEKQSFYTRMTGTDAWVIQSNSNSILVKHINSF